MADCNCDFGDCGGCGDCDFGDCDALCGDCKNCCLDCCDCNNIDCDCNSNFCRDCCNQCLQNPTSNTSRLRRFIVAIVVLMMLITDWITSSLNVSDYSNNKDLINNIYQIANSGPINNISFLTECPKNSLVLTQFYLPKIISGCYCPNNKTQIYNQTCNETQVGCLILGSQNTTLTQQWGYKQNYEHFQVCAKRTEINYNQLKTLNISQPQDCISKGLKLCQDQDEKFNFYCVNKTDLCPIRNIQRSSIINEFYQKIDQSFIEEDLIVSVTRNSTQNYLMNFQISRGKGICIDRNQLSQGVGQDYALNDPQWTNCNLDYTFNNFLTLSMQEFIKINGIEDSFNKTRPTFNMTQNVSLFVQKSLTTPHILILTSLFEYFDLSIMFLDIIIFISLGYWIYMVVIIVNEVVRCIFNLAEQCGQKVKKAVTVFLFYIVRFCIQVPLIVFTLLGFFLIVSTEKKIKTLSDDQNKDTLIIQILDFSTATQQKIKTQFHLLIGMVFAQLALDLIVSVWAYYTEQRKKKQKKQNLYNTDIISHPRYLEQTHPYKKNVLAQVHI